MTWTVSDVMTKNAATAHERPKAAAGVTTTGDTTLAAAASLMFQNHATVLQVVDSRNRLVGTVTRSQVLKAFLRSDKSIRTEILKTVVGPAAGRSVEVDVVRGLVQLRGEIDSAAKAERLIASIMALPGVVGVESGLSTPAEENTA